MPSHDVHLWCDRIFLGKEFRDVHAILDFPAIFLGAKHRILFHDPASVLILFGNDPERLMSALLHIAIDEAFTNMKIRKIKRRRGRRKRRRKLDAVDLIRLFL